MPSLVCAQSSVPSAPADTQAAAVVSGKIDRAEGLIKLDVVVTDAAGKPVSGLEPFDFNLLENRLEDLIDPLAIRRSAKHPYAPPIGQ